MRQVSLFHRDTSFSPFDEKEERLDDWYNHNVLKKKEYTVLSNVVKTGLSIFTAPHVESSFNLMKDIIDDRSTNMKIKTFSSVQTIKYGLKASGKSSVQYWGKYDYLHDQVDPNLCCNLKNSYQAYGKSLHEQKEKNQLKRASMDLGVPPKMNKKMKTLKRPAQDLVTSPIMKEVNLSSPSPVPEYATSVVAEASTSVIESSTSVVLPCTSVASRESIDFAIDCTVQAKKKKKQSKLNFKRL